MDDLDEADALVRRDERLTVALDVAALQQRLDDGRARGRGAEPVLPHGVGELLLVEGLARGLHGGEKRRVAEAVRRARTLVLRPRVQHIDGEALAQTARQLLVEIGARCFGQSLRLRVCILGRTLRAFDVENLPALSVHPRSAAVVVIDDRVAALHLGMNHRNDARRGVEVVLVPGREEAAANEVVDARLVPAERHLPRIVRRGEDGVVVAHAFVVDEARAERALARASRQLLGGVATADRAHDAGQLLFDVAREVAAVGTGIADQLLPLVEALRELERRRGGEAVEPVRVALQLGQVVEEGRGKHALAGLYGLHRGASAERALCDARRLLAVGRQATCAQTPLGRIGGVLGAALLRARLLQRRIEVGAVVARVPVGRLKGRYHLLVVLGHEAADGELPLHQHRERRRLHATDRERVAVGQRVRAGEVHPHQPVRPTATARGIGQRIHLVAVAQILEPGADGALGERRDPETADRFATRGGLVDVPEDQLPLAPRVRRADDLTHLGVVQDPADDLELIARARVHLERPGRGEHRQQLGPPPLPLGPDLMGLWQRHEVPDGPAHHVAVAVQVAVAAAPRPHDACDVARNARLLRQDGDAHPACSGPASALESKGAIDTGALSATTGGPHLSAASRFRRDDEKATAQPRGSRSNAWGTLPF